MKKFLNAWLPRIIFALAVLFVFKDFLLERRHTILSLGGDAAKNLYTYLYHVLYETGFWFGGMNYPYGENTVFTDNQPLISVTLGWLNKYVHFTPASLISILHWLIGISYWLGMVYTFKALKKFSVNTVIATIAAIFILILSPQVFRVTGHYPLSYACFLPMLFYSTILYHETKKWKYAIGIFFLCTAFALIHMYFLAMALLWMCGYVLGSWLTSKEKKSARLLHIAKFAGAICASVIFIQVLIKCTDPITDRPQLPYSTPAEQPLKMLFTSAYSPVWAAFQELHIIKETGVKQDAEGAAYIGIVLDAMMIAGLVIWFRSRRKKTPLPFRFDAAWLIAIGVVTLFAMGIGWIWDLPVLEKILKPLHQFRMPERLTWITYYVLSVYAGVVLNYIFTSLYEQRKRTAAFSVTILCCAIWGIEANGNIIYLRKLTGEWAMNYDFFFHPDNSTWTKFLAAHGKKNTDFQCIMVLPYMHVGSEKIWPGEDQAWTINLAYKAAIDLHLPIMNVCMSRSSWSQTFDQVKTAAGIAAEKPVLKKCNDKEMLVVIFRESNYQTTPDEDFIAAQGKYIGRFNDLEVYAVSPQRVVAACSAYTQHISRLASIQQQTDRIIGDSAWFRVLHCESDAGYRFAGTGGLRAIKGRDSLLLHWNLPADTARPLIEVSAWAKFPKQTYHWAYLTIDFKDSSNYKIGSIDALGKYSVDNDTALWFRMNKFFRAPKDCRSFDIRIMNPDLVNCEAFDELLIRKATDTVISVLPGGKTMVNNHVLRN